jgi:hypothetical protein
MRWSGCVALGLMGVRSSAAAIAAIAVCTAVACAPSIESTLPGPPTPQQLAELWVEPEPGRDLFHGVGGPALAPRPDVRYQVIEVKKDGFSAGYTVLDPDEREWSAKFFPEAHTEVVASRILWGLGYHQPPVYLLDEWTADKAETPNPQNAARFREEAPPFHGLTEAGNWSYRQNPFVGTMPMMGLLVFHVMLGNSDLKDGNNMLYTLEAEVEGARRWFVARDLGHTFGRTGVLNAPRDNAEVFDETPFILGVENDGRVRFDYRGRHGDLFEAVKVEHVRWICDRMSRLTDAQWEDAFRAGGYARPIYERYLRRLKEKIEEGRTLKGTL